MRGFQLLTIALTFIAALSAQLSPNLECTCRPAGGDRYTCDCVAAKQVTLDRASVGAAISATEAVMKVDEAFRIAKLKNDTAALSRLLAENFYETNQNGNSRNKAKTIELWASFPIESLTTDTSEVRITGDTAVVTGSQTEVNGGGTDRMLFMRIYGKGPGGWQLLSAMQFRNPR